MKNRLHVLVILSLPSPRFAVQQKANQFEIASGGTLTVHQGAEQNYETANARQAHHGLRSDESLTQSDNIKQWKNISDTSAAMADDSIERMLTSENAVACFKVIAQNYSDPQRMKESAWKDTPIQGTGWVIRDAPIVEMRCGGGCNAPAGMCGNFLYRAWYVGDGMYHNDDIMDLDETSPLGIPSPFKQHVKWHEIAHAPDVSIAILSAAAFVPTTWSTDWLMLGLGSGSGAKLFHWATPWSLDAVDIDKRAVDVAQNYFAFPQLPLKSSKNRQCLDDQRLCVTIADAFDYVRMLSAADRQYGIVFVDIGPAVFEWESSKQILFMKAIAAVSPVVVLNPLNSASFQYAFQIVRNGFDNAFCLPIPDNDRKCFVIGLNGHALSKEDAVSRAMRLDAQIGWRPFSLAAYLHDHPLKTALPNDS